MPIQEMWVLSLDWEDPLDKETATHTIIPPSFLAHGQRNLVGDIHGVSKSQTRFSDSAITMAWLLLDFRQLGKSCADVTHHYESSTQHSAWHKKGAQ